MRLISRQAKQDDFAAVYRDCCFGRETYDLAPAQAEQVWRTLTNSEGALMMVVEDQYRPANACIVGYQQAAFVNGQFSSMAKFGRLPYVNRHLAGPLCDGRTPLLDREEICELNSSQGLTLLTTEMRLAQLSAEDHASAVDYMRRKFEEFYLGYNIMEILHEAIGTAERKAAQCWGLRPITDHEAHFRHNPPRPSSELHPYLMGLARSEATWTNPSHRTLLYRGPRFFFTHAEQNVLRAALSGHRNEAIATRLNITRDTVRHHWKSIFKRVAQIDPTLLPIKSGNTRGEGKRHRLVDYVRDHPEELRPLKRPAQR